MRTGVDQPQTSRQATERLDTYLLQWTDLPFHHPLSSYTTKEMAPKPLLLAAVRFYNPLGGIP
jgi:hypothetical protein